jgi:hypothetical protein
MDDFQICEVSKDFRISITRPQPAVSAFINSVVESHWQEAVASNPMLFNGAVFSADTVTPSLITGHLTEFRRIVAQIRDPGLYEHLEVRPISLSGVLVCTEQSGSDVSSGFMLGRRSRNSIFQASVWQLAPAGCLDDKATIRDHDIDWRRQLLSELAEELGMPADAVEIIGPIHLVEYPGHHAIEIGIPLECHWTSETIFGSHRRCGNDEYEELQLIKAEDVLDVIGQLGERLSPTARIFLPRLLKTGFTRNFDINTRA